LLNKPLVFFTGLVMVSCQAFDRRCIQQIISFSPRFITGII
jgi:hypothetical protein